jgi:hypothetical protein
MKQHEDLRPEKRDIEVHGRDKHSGPYIPTQYVPFWEVHGSLKEVRSQSFSSKRMYEASPHQGRL